MKQNIFVSTQIFNKNRKKDHNKIAQKLTISRQGIISKLNFRIKLR